MVRPVQLPVTATFDAAEPWRVNLGAAFQDLVPGADAVEGGPPLMTTGSGRGPTCMASVAGGQYHV